MPLLTSFPSNCKHVGSLPQLIKVIKTLLLVIGLALLVTNPFNKFLQKHFESVASVLLFFFEGIGKPESDMSFGGH